MARDPFRSSLDGAKAKLHELSRLWQSRQDEARKVELHERVVAIAWEHRVRERRLIRDGFAMALGGGAASGVYAFTHWRDGETSWLILGVGVIIAMLVSAFRHAAEQKRFVVANADAQTELGVLETAKPVRVRVAMPEEIDAMDSLDTIHARTAEVEELVAEQERVLARARGTT